MSNMRKSIDHHLVVIKSGDDSMKLIKDFLKLQESSVTFHDTKPRWVFIIPHKGQNYVTELREVDKNERFEEFENWIRRANSVIIIPSTIGELQDLCKKIQDVKQPTRSDFAPRDASICTVTAVIQENNLLHEDVKQVSGVENIFEMPPDEIKEVFGCGINYQHHHKFNRGS